MKPYNVYAIQKVSNGLIKIGITSRDSLKYRMEEIRGKTKDQFKTIAFFSVHSREVEGQIHAILSKYMVGGEWFRPECFSSLKKITKEYLEKKQDYQFKLPETIYPKKRKRYERHDFCKLLTVGGDPVEVSTIVARDAAYRWAKKRGFHVHSEFHEGVYLVWRVE